MTHHDIFVVPCVKMRPEYVNTMDGDIVKHYKWYVSGNKFSYMQRRRIDSWCKNTFGRWRHDNEVDEGWWLQNEDEFTQFVLTWSGVES